MAARSRNENPAASAMPTIAAVTGSRTSAPVKLITPTKKHTAEPKTRSAAPRNIRIAMTVTPMGRCILPPFDHGSKNGADEGPAVSGWGDSTWVKREYLFDMAQCRGTHECAKDGKACEEVKNLAFEKRRMEHGGSDFRRT